MKKYLLAVAAVCLVSACASFKPDYEVKDASDSSKPKWTNQEKADKLDKTNRYYVDEAENVNKRLCLKAAETRATQKIASEIAQELMSKFKEKTASENDVADAKMKEELEQNIQVNLHGVTVNGKYWEKRAYKKELGAEKEYTAYKCDVLVSLKKTALIEALEAYKAKTLKTLKGEDKKVMNDVVTSYVSDLKNTADKE